MRQVQLHHRIAVNAVLTSLDTVKTSYKMHPIQDDGPKMLHVPHHQPNILIFINTAWTLDLLDMGGIFISVPSISIQHKESYHWGERAVIITRKYEHHQPQPPLVDAASS